MENDDTALRVLIVGGSPDRSGRETVCGAASDSDVIVAVDRGLDVLLDAGLSCDLFCGDADTVSAAGAQLVEQAQLDGSFEVERYNPHKDDTDLGLALSAIEERWPGAELMFTCVSCGSPDHALGVLGRLKDASPDPLTIVEDDFSAVILQGGSHWDIYGSRGQRFSCIPLSPVAVVSESGFRWDVDKLELPLLSDRGISNVVEDDDACVTCHAGTVICWLFE